MGVPPPRPASRRPHSRLAWILVVAAIAIPSLLLYGIMSCFGLGSDASALRGALMESARPGFHRQVELRLGWIPLSLVRQGLRLADLDTEARLALDSIRSVEVGVYGCGNPGEAHEGMGLLAAGDGVLEPRGWDRVVGVVHGDDVVGVYAQDSARDPDDLHFCVLVRHGDRLVLAAIRCRAGPILEILRESLEIPVSVARRRRS